MDASTALRYLEGLKASRESLGKDTSDLERQIQEIRGTKGSRATAKKEKQQRELTPREEEGQKEGTRHKFNAEQVIVREQRFDSKAESKYNDHLEELKALGEVLFFLRQVPFHMPGRQKYICDFQVFWRCGRVTFEDRKGAVTPEFASKMRMMEESYPHVCIELIQKGLVRRPATRAMQEVRSIPEMLEGTSQVQPWSAEHCSASTKGKNHQQPA